MFKNIIAINNYDDAEIKIKDFCYIFEKLLTEYNHDFFDKANITVDKLIGLIEANREHPDELFVNIYLKEERIILQKIKIRAATYFLKAKLLTIEKDFEMAKMYFNRAEKIQNKFELSKSENGDIIQKE